MASPHFNTSTPLSGHGFYPNIVLWDDVLIYNKFFAQIRTDQPCKLTVYESNNSSPTLSNSVVYTYYYESLNNCVIIEGGTICNQISFSLENLSGTDQTTLYFSVVYK